MPVGDTDLATPEELSSGFLSERQIKLSQLENAELPVDHRFQIILQSALLLDSSSDSASKRWKSLLLKSLGRSLQSAGSGLDRSSAVDAVLKLSNAALAMLVDATKKFATTARRHMFVDIALVIADAIASASTAGSLCEKTLASYVHLIGSWLLDLPAPSRALTAAVHSTNTTLVEKHKLLSLITDCWLGTDSTSSAPATFSVLALFVRPVPAFDAVRPRLVRALSTNVLRAGSPQTIPAKVFVHLKPFLRSITSSEWSSVPGKAAEDAADAGVEQLSLEVIALRLIKKAPENASRLMRVLCEELQVPLDAFATGGGVTGGLRMLKSDSTDTRAHGRSLLVTLLFKCSAVGIAASVDEIMATISNRAATNPSQRAEAAAVLTAAADLCLARPDEAQVSQAVAPKLLTELLGPTGLLAKEIDENVRILLAGVAGPWLASQIDAMACIPLRKLIEGGLSGKTLLAHLMALNAACSRNGSFLAHFDNLWAPLAAVLAKPLPTNRCDCLLALRALLQASAVNDSAAALTGAKEGAKYWDVLVKEGSYVHHMAAAFLPAAGADEDLTSGDLATASARALEEIITEARCAVLSLGKSAKSITLFSVPAERSAVVKTLEMCLLHPSPAVRRRVYAHCRDLQQGCSGASAAILVGLLARTQEAAYAAQLAQPSRINFKEWGVAPAATPAWTAPGNRIANAMVSLAEEAPVFEKPCIEAFEFLSSLILLCCHPVTTSGSAAKARSMWISCRVEHLAKDPNVIFGDDRCLRTVCSSILTAVASLNEASRAAAITALGLISEVAQEGGVGHWSEQLWHSLSASLYTSLVASSSQLSNLSVEDMRLFKDPAGAIAEAMSAVQSKTVDVKITNADRKKTESRSARKGGFGADLAEDEDWVDRVKSEKLRKAQEVQGAAVEDACAELRARIDSVTATVNAKKAETCGLLNSFAALLGGYSGGAKFVHSNLLNALLPLLTNDLVSAESELLLRAIVQASLQTAGALSESLNDVCHSLCAVASTTKAHMTRYQKFTSDAALAVERMQRLMRRSGPLVRVLRSAAAAAGRSSGRGLPVAAFAVLFPILECLLSLPTSLPGCDMTFQVLADCLPREAHIGEVLSSVIELCLRAQRRVRIEPKPELILRRLCVENGKNISDWMPLVGSLGLLAEEVDVRAVCLRVLQSAFESLAAAGQKLVGDITLQQKLAVHLLIARCDSAPECSALGATAWTAWTTLVGAADGGLAAEACFGSILPIFSNKVETVRACAARAVAQAAMLHTSSTATRGIFKQLQTLYNANLPEQLGPSVRGARAAADDHVGTRVAVSLAIGALGVNKVLLAPGMSQSQQQEELMQVVRFVSTVGAGDRSVDVRDAMLQAGRDIVDIYGEAHVQSLLTFFGAELRRTAKAGEDMDAFDARHEAAVVLLGAAGKFAPTEDTAQLQGIISTLVDALKTPSEAVQIAVADCLAPLVTRLKGHEGSTDQQFEDLLYAITEAPTYGERRGAAFGVSAFVKGLGIASLKAHNVVNRLKESCDGGSNNARQGALSAFECLSGRLGLLFEPYVVTIVPSLLKSFSHASDHVRDAAQSAARAIMGRLSAHGIKQVLAPILASLPTETQWKTRQESIRLLGTMAHCAPKQLAACLPQIVPRLVEAGSDPHPKVKEGAKMAMEDIATVIRNPEISRLSPMLLAALSDPANRTKTALEALLECEFMHSIDAPSLALLVPILSRALRDRGADIKRKSAAITGNMVSMVTDQKFLLPYLSQILPGLKDCLVDPIPDVRATSSKALGSLAGGVGEVEDMQELVPWLMLTLCTESSPVERSGAAQGLADICNALGAARLADVLQQTLPLCNSQSYAAREGLLWLLSFLPTAMPQPFAQHISTTLPVVLGGLSDSVESVREIALRAGQVVVSTLGHQYTSELLPSLCDGMFNDDWRIRHASIKLVGELLCLVGDTKGVTDIADADEEDENENAGSTGKVLATIKAHIGNKLTESILASLYIARNDVSGPCRQSALQVWKSVVTNTPRAMVEIMGELVLQLVQKLASDSDDMRVVAGRALGDTVSKLGDRILPTVMPYMSRGLNSPDAAMRQGVCLGLAEILNSSSKRQIEDYVDVLVPALQQGFCDSSESVRKQAAKAFQTLFKAIGPQSIGIIVPDLMRRIRSKPADAAQQVESETALLGLQELLSARPRDIVEFIVPAVIRSPMTSHGCFVLGGLANASGKMFQYHITAMVTSFVSELTRVDSLAANGDDAGTILRSDICECASKCFGAITTEGVNVLMQELSKQIDHDDSRENRRWGCFLMEQFVAGSTAEYREYIPLILKGLLTRVADTYQPLLDAVRCALSAVAEKVPMDRLMAQVEFMRSCIASTASDARHRAGGSILLNAEGQLELPMLALPKALEPFLAIYNYGLVNATPEKREACADAMGELFKMTSSASLKPYLIKSTGPLIRVAGDRFPSNVKTAILNTLCILLEKGGASLKAFAPQLQTTFVKALSDASKQTRQRAVAGLGLLMSISARTDGLLTELSNACSVAEGNAIRSSILEALGETLRRTTAAPSAASLEKVRSTVIAYLLTEDEEFIRSAAAQCLRALSIHTDEEATVDCITQLVAQTSSANWTTTMGALSGAAAVYVGAGGVKAASTQGEVFRAIEQGMNNERSMVKMSACNASAVLWAADGSPGASVAAAALQHLLDKVVNVAADSKNDDEVRKAAVISLKVAAKGAGAGVHVLTQRQVVRVSPALIKATRELDPQLQYHARRALFYMFHRPIGSTALSEAIANSAEADTINFLRDYQKRKPTVLDEANSDNES